MPYTIMQIAEKLDKTRQAVAKRAAKEDWPRSKQGRVHVYELADLPEDIRLAIATKECVKNAPATPAPVAPVPAPSCPVDPSAPLRLTGKQRTRSAARSAAVVLYQNFQATSGMAETPAMEAFCARWKAGEIEAEPWVRQALPRFCKNSLGNWLSTVRTKGAARLGGKYGQHRKGTGLIDSQPELQDVILGVLHEHPHASGQLVHEALLAKFKGTATRVPSLRRLQEWLSAWKMANASAYAFLKAPDAWRGRFLASCGEAYSLICRQNQRWEYDGTPSDIMLNNGKRYTITGVINVYDRRLRLDVVPSSTARDVAALTRRCILEWGIPEEAVTDNGKDFVAIHVQQLFISLGVHQTILPPFRPDLKPAIERAFNSFSHHLLTLAPCYVGHDVATRQQIRERETFAKRLFDKDAELSMALSPEELQAYCDEWTDNVYAHRSHKGLGGRTPYEVAASWIAPVRRVDNERALDILLIPLASKGGWRTVTKKGVPGGHGLCVAPELGAWIGHRVQVRLDPHAPAHAYIFAEDGTFICRADNTRSLDGEARQSVAKAARSLSETTAKATKRDMADAAKRTDADQIFEDIRDYHNQRAAEIRTAMPMPEQRAVPHTTPELDAAADALRADVPPVALTEQAREVVPGFMPPATEQARYQLYLELSARTDLDELAARWVRHYGASSECSGFRDMYEMLAMNG